jgi:hypothetical protein
VAVRSYDQTAVPGRFERHMLNRMGTGYTPGSWAQLQKAGGAMQWFEEQLDPDSVAESSKAEELLSWFPDLPNTWVKKWDDTISGRKGGWLYAQDLECLTILRRVHSRRPVLEMMVDFWGNHLHVPSGHDIGFIYRFDYDNLLRERALGRFEDLLVAATLHPAMIGYLDTWRSVARAPNENHGRELLELHTVGRTAGYTEAMVKDSAKILSGHTLDAYDTWQPSYVAARHATGPVQVLGFSHANSDADGRAVAEAYLRYLAQHPATAATLARRLAVKFVSDAPSASLVDELARVYLDNDTHLRPVLRALVRHPEFAASTGKKTRTPHEDLIATMRVLKVRAARPTGDEDFANSTLAWAHGGLSLYQWPRPDGAPEDGDPYASASRMMSSFDMHWGLAAGWWTSPNVTYRPVGSWLPQRRIAFDRYVDHLSRLLHGRPARRGLVDAAVRATGVNPGAVITKDHAVADWLGVRLLGVLLDHPEHMSR